MKSIKKSLALLLAVVLVLALSTTALAADEYSITVTNTNKSVSINGNTYKAYKVFDVTYSGEHFAYTVSDQFKDFIYVVDENTSYTGEALIKYLSEQENNSEVLDAFAKAALAYATEKGFAPAGTSEEAAEETAVIGLTEPGYYLVTGTATAPNDQTVTAACSLTTTKPTAEVNPKVDAPSVDKKIVEGENKVVANTANIGDSVKYEITSKVPNMKGYEKYFFVINDTLSKGLTFNDDMVVTVGSTTLTKQTDPKATDGYTLTVTPNEDGTTSIEIIFNNFIQYQTGLDVKITYTATVNQDAVLDPTVGNPNEVKLTYSNNPNQTGTGTTENPNKPAPGDATGETPKSETKTYVTGLKLTKTDKDGNKLTGAKFSIKGDGMKVVLVNKTMYKESENGTYYMLKDGTYTEAAPVTDKDANGYNADKYDSVTTKYEKVTVVDKTTVPAQINATGYVNENGVLTFEGLGEGDYEITEIIAPDGYNMLKESIKVKISADETLDKCTWTVTVNGEEVSVDGLLYAFSVVNTTGTELPSTGGIGTTIFYILGSLLVVGAVVVLITKKRMNAEN